MNCWTGNKITDEISKLPNHPPPPSPIFVHKRIIEAKILEGEVKYDISVSFFAKDNDFQIFFSVCSSVLHNVWWSFSAVEVQLR